MRLRATADALVKDEVVETRRKEVELACQAYLQLMLGRAEGDAVTQLRRRSARYLRLVADSSHRLVTHANGLLVGLLRGCHTGDVLNATAPL